MHLSDFDYNIPEKQIAQHPLKDRDASRLLILDKLTGHITHRSFRDIPSYFQKGDVLILNNTKVIPVRLYGNKPSGGKVEITLLKESEKNTWTALVKNVSQGKVILQKGITARVSRLNGTVAKVKFNVPDIAVPDIKNHLYEMGAMPLPVYIKRDSIDTDLERYQTIYAKREGAVAAPTAGLHFTSNILNLLKNSGVEIQTITLHVGYGTFKPVTAVDIAQHIMDEECFEIPEATADAINSAKTQGRRVIAVGTTVTRALEGAAGRNRQHFISPGGGSTSIFIYPGYKFKIIDSLLTNFHLPQSTPMMLAAAFTELKLLKNTYKIAQTEGYRFYSYGDAMLIV